MANEGPLSVAVICTGDAPPRWQVEALLAMAGVPGVRLSLIVFEAVDTRPEARLMDRFRGPRWRRAFVDNWAFRGQRFPAVMPTPLPEELRNVPTLPSTGDDGLGTAGTLTDAQVEALKRAAPDVLIHLGRSLLADLTPAHGIWSVEPSPAADPAGLDELLTGRDQALLTFKRNGIDVLAELCTRVTPHGIEVQADRMLAHLATWPAQGLADLLNGRLVPVSAAKEVEVTEHKAPGNAAFLSFLMARLLPGTVQPARLNKDREWNIGILHQPISSLLNAGGSLNVRWLPAPPEGCHRMEAFGYIDGEQRLNAVYLKVDERTGQRSISRLRPKGDNVLKRSRHLLELADGEGYPFILTAGSDVLMVLGSTSRGRTELYRLNGESTGFDLHAELLDEVLLSPTLFEHEGRWWLMGTTEALPDEALRVFHGPSLTGPFLPHANDPVKMDLRSARPAGTPFVWEGQLWRPALDGSDPVRPRVVLNHVDRLSPAEFRETPARHMPYFLGTTHAHGVRTVCAMGEVTLVDGLRISQTTAPRSKRSKKKGRSSRSGRS